MTGALARLRSGAGRIVGRELTEAELAMFGKYLDLMVKWQTTHRLVGSGDPQWIVEHLFLDSLLYTNVVPVTASDMLDIGSGSGIPGIPIKIVRPHVRLTLLESRRRRASFLSAVIRDLGLIDARIINARAEDVRNELASRFDAVVMRCAGRLNMLIPLARSFLRAGGVVVASGPPRPVPGLDVEWIQLAGVSNSATRTFAVSRR